jgi:AcrR family transcriptional regulator
MSDDRPPPRGRVGRDAIIEAGADLLAAPTLPDLLGFAGVRAVAERADVRPGTVTHRFPAATRENRRANPALAEALARRAVERGRPTSGHTIDALATEIEGLGRGDGAALHRIAEAMGRDLVEEQDPAGQSFLTAYYACLAAAPHDPVAAAIVREHHQAFEDAFTGVYQLLVDTVDRRFITGLDERAVGAAMWALAEGYYARLRGQPDAVAPAEFALVTIRLFEALTVDAAELDEPWAPDEMVDALRPEEPDYRDRHAVVAAARALYTEEGRWEAVTNGAVARRSGRSRAVVAAVFPDRGSLAAAVWAGELEGMAPAIERDRDRPLDQILWRQAQRLVEAARAHPQLAASYLESGRRAAAGRGRLDTRDHTDPRAMLLLPQLLVRILHDHADELRPEVTASSAAVLGFAGLFTRSAIDLALSEGELGTAEIADLLTVLVVDGVRRRVT